VGGRLQMVWGYNGRRYRRETIERIAGRYLETLREVIEHCRSEEAGGYTPSDFPLANLTQDQLDLYIGKGAGMADSDLTSPMQQGLLFHALYAPNSRAYFLQMGCQMRGELDAAAFRRAWEELVSRHDILRTGFLWQGVTQPLQVVREHVDLPWS